jgi:hypothetical protein
MRPYLATVIHGIGPTLTQGTGAANGVVSDLLPHTSMSLTFASRSLQRTFALEDLTALTKTQLRVLHEELIKAIEAMDNKIEEVQTEEKLGVTPEVNWLHRISKKKAICKTFVDQVSELMLETKGPFEHIYRLKLEQLLLDELGEDTWQEIKDEAMQFALASLPQAVPAS